ncbi:MAG: hypothetical protein ACOYNC_04980 [Bacteroidales bacterium]
MARNSTILLLLFFMILRPMQAVHAQDADPYAILGKLKQKTAAIKSYTANIEIRVDVDFIKMPIKHARLFFKEPDKISFKSSDFIMLPRRGFHNSLSKMLNGQYLAISMGKEMIGTRKQDVIKIIPSEKKSDVILATWWIDCESGNVTRTESNTRDQGTFVVDMKYQSSHDVLPVEITVRFEIEGMSIPLRFIGKSNGMTIDKQKSKGKQEGKVIIRFTDYKINGVIEDSVFSTDNTDNGK